MGIDLTIYRAAIGSFYANTHRRLNLPKSYFNIKFHTACVFATFALLFVRYFIKNDTYTAYRLILLLICMDVHLHPGRTITDIHSLDIIQLNSRSIRHKLDNIYDVADDFYFLCFSETHLDPSIGRDTLELEGFDTQLRKDRSQHGGGVMVYIFHSLKYERHEEFEDHRLKSIWIEVKLKMQNILICCFYRSGFNTSQSVLFHQCKRQSKWR